MERRSHYRALIALKLIPELGPRRIKKLLEAVESGNASEIFKLDPRKLHQIDLIGDHIVKSIRSFNDWEKADRILEQTSKIGADLVALDDSEYPMLLRHIYDPPPLLWIKGHKQVLNQPGIAVIGTRNPGSYGLKQAEKWSQMICGAGLSVNSGLAYGIDSAAHAAALKTGGKTIAVLGSGLDVIYPAKNIPLVKSIIEKNGAVISEYMPGTMPEATHFPERNRIVSGMSHGVLVVESGIKGGSMITARCALDQNREVFVVPHQADYAKGEGGNYLIKTGQGKLVQGMQDIADEISVEIDAEAGDRNQNLATRNWREMELNPEAQKICKILENGELHIDTISELTGNKTHELMVSLLELELTGAIRQRAGKYFGLC